MSFLPELPSSKPSQKLSALLALAGLFIAADAAIWLAFVPERLTVQTFSWLSALAFTIVIATAVTTVRARATRSIAHVLYDVEHPSQGPGR